MTKSTLGKNIRFLFLSIGIALLCLLIHKIGLATVIASARELGWLLIPIIAISFLWYILYTAAWMQFLRRLENRIGFFDLLRIKLTGEAVNTLTPANFIGGDPMRIYLLKKNFPVLEGAASVVVDRTLHSVATLIVVLLGIVVGFVTFERLPANLKFGVPIALIVSLSFMIFLLVHQRRGLFGLLINACRKLGLKREFSQETVNRFMELDAHIIDFYHANHKGFILALTFHTAGRMLGLLEIFLVGKTISDDFTLFAALMLTALAPMVNAIFTFIPGAIGVLEGAYSGTLYLMHMDPALGITIQIAKRIRAAFWIILGLLFLGSHDRKKVWEEKELIEEV